jgi:hypothetical protein
MIGFVCGFRFAYERLSVRSVSSLLDVLSAYSLPPSAAVPSSSIDYFYLPSALLLPVSSLLWACSLPSSTSPVQWVLPVLQLNDNSTRSLLSAPLPPPPSANATRNSSQLTLPLLSLWVTRSDLISNEQLPAAAASEQWLAAAYSRHSSQAQEIEHCVRQAVAGASATGSPVPYRLPDVDTSGARASGGRTTHAATSFSPASAAAHASASVAPNDGGELFVVLYLEPRALPARSYAQRLFIGGLCATLLLLTLHAAFIGYVYRLSRAGADMRFRWRVASQTPQLLLTLHSPATRLKQKQKERQLRSWLPHTQTASSFFAAPTSPNTPIVNPTPPLQSPSAGSSAALPALSATSPLSQRPPLRLPPLSRTHSAPLSWDSAGSSGALPLSARASVAGRGLHSRMQRRGSSRRIWSVRQPRPFETPSMGRCNPMMQELTFTNL